MFCPKCRTEYRQGFYVCSDCKSDLVDELPPENKPEFIDYVELFGTYNSLDVALIKSILDSEGITYYFNPDNFMNVSPLTLPAKLMVKKDEAKKAKEILKGLNLSFFGIDLGQNNPDIDK